VASVHESMRIVTKYKRSTISVSEGGNDVNVADTNARKFYELTTTHNKTQEDVQTMTNRPTKCCKI